MKFIRERIKSDKAAVMSTEMLILLVLGVFAALVLFRYILTPVQNSAEGVGTGIQAWFGELLDGTGDANPEFNFNPGTKTPTGK